MRTWLSKWRKTDSARSILASILSILIGMAVGCVIVLIVATTSKDLSMASAWEGIRLIFGGLFSTGRTAAGALTFGFNPTNLGNMLFRATPLIMTGLSVAVAFKTGLFICFVHSHTAVPDRNPAIHGIFSAVNLNHTSIR